jgi:uracil-DNA glycosylase family 4
MSDLNDVLDKVSNYFNYIKDKNLLIFEKEVASYQKFLNSEFEYIPEYSESLTDTDTTIRDKKEDNLKFNLTGEDWQNAEFLDELYEKIKECKKCDLWKTRTNFVFGTGNPKAKVVVVGEAPGAEEDKQGKPFVGRAGQLLTQILASVNFTREEVFICNVLKSRPPENRNPTPEEIRACEPYLIKQLDIIKPKLILCVGTFAAQTLLKTKDSLGKMRGQFHTYNGIPLMVTFHPAALLRNPNWKRPTWEDVQLFRKEYDKLMANA